MKNTKVYLMSTENVKDPRTFALWKEFLPKEHWEKTVRPLKEEDRKTELLCMVFIISGTKRVGDFRRKNQCRRCVLLWRTWQTDAKK